MLGISIFEELIETIRNRKFSLFIDETTEKNNKSLAIVVRFFNEKKLKFETRLFKLIKPGQCNAEALFNEVFKAFKSNNISLKENCIGFASDNTNTMVGLRNSVVSRLKTEIPEIVIFDVTKPIRAD